MEFEYCIQNNYGHIKLKLTPEDINHLEDQRRIPEDIMTYPFVEILDDNHDRFNHGDHSKNPPCTCSWKSHTSSDMNGIYITQSLFEAIKNRDSYQITNVRTNDIGIILHVNGSDVCPKPSLGSPKKRWSTLKSFIQATLG
ncbi:MAG TPA: hypothetical protein PK048_03790 [Candidatus Absconditabacterales bacterium]|nr:hypothetical protein [Candidatus Absconditabacterales bacterium]